MSIGGLIFGQMTMMAQSNSSRLGFPALIIAFCRSRGVGSDALTSYENHHRPNPTEQFYIKAIVLIEKLKARLGHAIL